MTLPKEFTDRMQALLGDEYAAFLQSYEETRRYGLRVNTLKADPAAFAETSSFHLTEIDWIPGAYTYLQEDQAARHPYYQAGLYYLQEPSAMTPASVLDVRPGDRVLDLCAAPGGKTTALGAKLQGKGLLVANDISASRCKALLKNIELFGIPNAVVTNAPPHKLTPQFEEFFDAILVDAPCSGEGMFRKDEATVRAWYPEKPEECAKTQRQIVTQAVQMLRPGGRMLYSTCTFAPQEDEEIIAWILEEFPEMKLLPIEHRQGFSEGLNGLTDCVRLWPHKTGGEGHFLALLQKAGGDDTDRRMEGAENVTGMPGGTVSAAEAAESAARTRDAKKARQKSGRQKNRKDTAGVGAISLAEQFLSEIGAADWLYKGRLEQTGDYISLIPEALTASLAGITYLRRGLLLGQVRKDRFEPSQALAMALDARQMPERMVISLSPEDSRTRQYLRGETVNLSAEEAGGKKGWVLVCTDGYPVGWAKCTGQLLKNKYLAGWRLNN